MTALATDNFNRADQAGLSASWATISGLSTLNIVSNRASAPSDPCGNRYTGVTWPNDQYSQCAIITPLPLGGAEGGGPAGRIATAATTMYIAIFNTADSEMYSVVGGSYTQIGSGSTIPTTGQIAYLSMVGTTIAYKLAGTTQASVTDSSIASGQAGIFGAASTNNAIVDDWEGGDFSGGAATQNIALNGYAAPGIYGSAASAPGAVGVSPSGYAARGIYGAAAAAPGAVNIALNGLVAQGIYGALTANSIYPVTLSPVVAQAIFGNDTVTPGAANIAPSSVVGQAIFGAISAAMGSTQDIQPASVVGQGVSGSFTLVPGAVSLSLGDTVAQGVSGSFSLAPGAVGLSLTGYAAKGAYGPLTMSFNINMNSIVAQASIGGLAIAVGPVTVLPNSLVAQSEFGPLVVTIPGGTAALIAQSQLFIGMGIRI